ncbi:MAG: SlyX family protein [Gammaproteobacteria bacterium]|jgi:SlyX protein
MASENELLARIELLESKVAFQDDTIEQLNQSLIELNNTMLAIRGDLVLLAEKLNNANESTTDPTQIEIPPHY